MNITPLIQSGNGCIQRRFQKWVQQSRRSLHGSSVDACWHPLTPEHGFPSLIYKTQGAPPQSATSVDLVSPFPKRKQENTFVVSSCHRAKAFPTAALSTSGIRVEGVSFLSACHHKLPLHIRL